MNPNQNAIDHKATRKAIVKYFDGEFYTRYLAKGYDKATTLTGWRRKLAEHSFKGLKPCKMLDVGCGTGYMMDKARKLGFDVRGIDPSEGMIQLAQKQYGFSDDSIFMAPADKLPFPDNSFELTFASGSFEYVPNMKETVEEIRRVLKKGGIMRIIDHAVPKKRNLFTGLVFLYTQASGHLLHDYEYYFRDGFKFIHHETLGRAGYMQLFDFQKL